MIIQKAAHGVEEQLRNADVFTTPIHLTLQKKRMLSTTLGGALSLAFLIFLISQTMPRLINMGKHLDFQLYQINELEEDPAEIVLGQGNNWFIGIIISINDVNVDLRQESPFNFRTTFNKYTRLLNGTRVKVKHPVFWAPCNASDFPEETFGKNAYKTYSLKDGFCVYAVNYTHPIDGSCPTQYQSYPNCIAPPSFDIQGTFLAEEFDFIQSNLVLCDQNDPTLPYGMVCDTNTLASFASSVYKLNLYYANTIISPINYETPNKTLLDNVYWNLNPRISKVADIFVDRNTIQDYDDYVSDIVYNNRSYFSIQVDKIRDLESVQATAVSTFMQFNIRRSTLNIVYARTYSKILEILTDLGGLSKTIMVIASIVAMGYVRYKYFMMLSTELYEFKRSEPKKDEKKKEAPEVRSLNGFSMMEFSENKVLVPGSPGFPDSPISLLNIDENKTIRNYFEGRKARQPLKYNEWAYLKKIIQGLCCRTSVEEKLAKKGRELANKDLDIIVMIKKLQEVDRLKYLLFQFHQRNAFDFMDKPLITVDSKKAKIQGKENGTVKYSRTETVMERGDSPMSRGGTMASISLRSINTMKNNVQVKKFKWEDKIPLSKYGKLYVAYRHLLEDTDPENTLYNRKLIGMIDRGLLKVFRRVDQMNGGDPDRKMFEDAIKQALENNEVSLR